MDAKERRKVPAFTRILALMCVRQSRLETLHRGLSPITHTGDYSDVVVVDAEGRRIPWPEVSRFGEDEMRDLRPDRQYRMPPCPIPTSLNLSDFGMKTGVRGASFGWAGNYSRFSGLVGGLDAT